MEAIIAIFISTIVTPLFPSRSTLTGLQLGAVHAASGRCGCRGYPACRSRSSENGRGALTKMRAAHNNSNVLQPRHVARLDRHVLARVHKHVLCALAKHGKPRAGRLNHVQLLSPRVEHKGERDEVARACGLERRQGRLLQHERQCAALNAPGFDAEQGSQLTRERVGVSV